MSSMDERLRKLREERVAREKARIEKLRELNLKKYNTPNQPTNQLNNNPRPLLKANSTTQVKNVSASCSNTVGRVKNHFHVNGTTKRPITVPVTKKSSQTVKNLSPVKDVKKQSPIKDLKIQAKIEPKASQVSVIPKMGDNKNVTGKAVQNQAQAGSSKNLTAAVKPDEKISSQILTDITDKKVSKTNLSKFALTNSMRKSLAAPVSKIEKPGPSRKSMLPKIVTNKESVFDRLYKHKIDHSIKETNLRKVIKTTDIILHSNPNKVRRSISAVHFKRMNKNEMNNCIHKWSSVSDRLNTIHDEDDMITEDKVTSAIKCERKKVRFMSPMCLNTPRPEELQLRLKNWLQKRGKSLDSYHHLQCFGFHHLSKTIDHFDEDNKENIALESDSDDGSYNENMNEDNKQLERSPDFEKWRRVSSVNESVDFNDSRQDTLTETEEDSIDPSDIVMGALTDLVELIREGFDWKQSTRWLLAIRERYPTVASTASYWECRAALEERRGNLPASVHCWEEAIAKGIGHSVVEANLDQLLDKFMQLKISPKSGAEKKPDPKLVDVKNVFKSTIIRFAVTQAKLRQSQTPVVCVTPVRRSGRLSVCPSSQRLCDNMRQISQIAPEHQFTPNPNLVQTP